MRLRLVLSALFTLIAAMVLASQGRGLLEKFKILPTSSANNVSQAHALPDLPHSFTAGSQHRAAGTISPAAKINFHFPHATHCLGSQEQSLRRFVLNLIDSDHQGEYK